MEEKIVYAYVVADILHIGHIIFLEKAKSFGDKLVVGVLTDNAVMEKKQRPIMSFEERIQIIKALKCVDVVVAQETYSPISNLKNIKPDILMESTSHTEEDLRQTKEVAEAIGTKIMILPYFSKQCSTNIKNSIKSNFQELKGGEKNE